MQNVIASSYRKSLIGNCIAHEASTFFATHDIQYCIPLFYQKDINKPCICKAILKEIKCYAYSLIQGNTYIYLHACIHISLICICDCYA